MKNNWLDHLRDCVFNSWNRPKWLHSCAFFRVAWCIYQLVCIAIRKYNACNWECQSLHGRLFVSSVYNDWPHQKPNIFQGKKTKLIYGSVCVQVIFFWWWTIFLALKMISMEKKCDVCTFLWAFSFVGVIYVWNWKNSRVIFPFRDAQMLTVTIIMLFWNKWNVRNEWDHEPWLSELTGWMGILGVWCGALSCLAASKNVLEEIFRWTFAERIKRLHMH